MSREMVSVRLYEDRTYDVEDASPHHATAQLYGFKDGKYCDVYYCPKADWRKYLLKLLSTKDVDEKTKNCRNEKEDREIKRKRLQRR